MVFTVNSFRVEPFSIAHCARLDDMRRHADFLVAHQCMELYLNPQDDDLGHSHVQKVFVQQRVKVFNFRMHLGGSQSFQRSLLCNVSG